VHAEPELSHRETGTTALVDARLRSLGLEPLDAGTPTGAVYRLRGGRPGASVLLRADIDALPLLEEVDVPWRSRVEGVMHACGHDGHTAVLLGVASALAARAESLPGEYVLLFQPAEEDIADPGAPQMLRGGVLDGVRADRMVSLHLATLLATGLVGTRAGVAMSSAQFFRISISGKGGHGSMATRDGNVVLAVSELSTLLPGVAESLEYEEIACACSAGLIRAGHASNVVPRTAMLEGTIRTFTAEQHDTTLDRLHDVCARIAGTYSVQVDTLLPDAVPAVVNDSAAVQSWRAACEPLLGADRVLDLPPMPPTDDVAYFLQRIPGVHFFVGAAPGARIPPMHHAPDFTIDEESLRIAALGLIATAIRLAAEA
jgi:amidohydrolase